jgi:hypothetical protein
MRAGVNVCGTLQNFNADRSQCLRYSALFKYVMRAGVNVNLFTHYNRKKFRLSTRVRYRILDEFYARVEMRIISAATAQLRMRTVS